ncbi:alanine dehydrogenase [Demequina sp. SYSU T00192]|uniref:Alanine dehydrogenase n=1 Tax=Demequina litoralis TaxID=3051660 RepID=A0ABT8G6V6_9MICO|nr:alanine dehydrogenase [Demequina sp. SYSU T00192]MDN4474871.1 alanine dehydrogenase [Demequina sp. SYSU T00192]
MRVGVPAETKSGETRVALAPAGIDALTSRGHEVLVQAGAGRGAGIADADLEAAGARLVAAPDAWAADLVVKVKEPQPEELPLLRGNALLTFLHLAANPALAAALRAAGTTALSYDTVQLPDGSLPLLTPMSEVAGRLAVLAGAHHLLSPHGGRGVLLAGVPGVPGARVTVLGAGVAGSQAVAQAAALGADVTAVDLSLAALRRLDERHAGRVRTVVSTAHAIEAEVRASDLVIGAVLVPGRPAPKVVTHAMVEAMAPGSVLVDIAIDQGGCFEDSRPTTHEDPVRRVAGSLLYAVANMPAAVGVTATRALTNVTLPYVLRLADGVDDAVDADPALAAGVNVRDGRIVHPAVAAALGEAPAPA